MNDTQSLFSVLRQSANAEATTAIERLVRDGTDRELNRINLLSFAAKAGLDEERTIATFLHAARLGLFDLSWNVLCPGCGDPHARGHAPPQRRSRVQGLAQTRSIFATEAVVEYPPTSALLETRGLTALRQHRALAGIGEVGVYEIA